MHILISGEIGVGKSTLINKLLQGLKQPAHGFRTEKTAESGHVYIHAACAKKRYTEDNLVGLCMPTGMKANTAIFESLGVNLLTNIPAGSVVLMDELGFLESRAPGFCNAVENVLDGPYFVLAAVKPLDTDFLNKVRAHKNAMLFNITTVNRDSLYEHILASGLNSPLCRQFSNRGY